MKKAVALLLTLTIMFFVSVYIIIQDNISDIIQENTSDAGYTLSNAVVIDDENYKFVITSVKINKKGTSPKVIFNVICENKTNEAVYFHACTERPNEGIVSAHLCQEVKANKKIKSEMRGYVIDSDNDKDIIIDELTFMFGIFKDSTQVTLKTEYTIYPTSLEPNKIILNERVPVENEKIIVENHDFSFVIKGMEIIPNRLLYYVENNTSKKLKFDLKMTSNDGYTINAYLPEYVSAEKRGSMIVECPAYDVDGKPVSLKKLKEIEFELTITDSDDLNSEPIYKGTVVYNPWESN